MAGQGLGDRGSPGALYHVRKHFIKSGHDESGCHPACCRDAWRTCCGSIDEEKPETWELRFPKVARIHRGLPASDVHRMLQAKASRSCRRRRAGEKMAWSTSQPFLRLRVMVNVLGRRPVVLFMSISFNAIVQREGRQWLFSDACSVVRPSPLRW